MSAPIPPSSNHQVRARASSLTQPAAPARSTDAKISGLAGLLMIRMSRSALLRVPGAPILESPEKTRAAINPAAKK